jgi:hypothetical protein
VLHTSIGSRFEKMTSVRRVSAYAHVVGFTFYHLAQPSKFNTPNAAPIGEFGAGNIEGSLMQALGMGLGFNTHHVAAAHP